MPETNTLQTMDDNELLGKVDELFEWITRQAGDGPIEAWTLAGLQSEIRRRIMERHAEVIVEPKPDEITVEVRQICLKPEHPVDAPTPLIASVYRITVWNRRSSRRVFLPMQEAQSFLKGLEVARTFGLPFEAIPGLPPEI